MSAPETVTVETTGETVGEAKWAALRELETLVPGLDRESVRFQVVTAGERKAGRVAIAAGLLPGQCIVLDPPSSLRDGSRVRPIPK